MGKRESGKQIAFHFCTWVVLEKSDLLVFVGFRSSWWASPVFGFLLQLASLFDDSLAHAFNETGACFAWAICCVGLE